MHRHISNKIFDTINIRYPDNMCNEEFTLTLSKIHTKVKKIIIFFSINIILLVIYKIVHPAS
jgi:hypothetical protein